MQKGISLHYNHTPVWGAISNPKNQIPTQHHSWKAFKHRLWGNLNSYPALEFTSCFVYFCLRISTSIKNWNQMQCMFSLGVQILAISCHTNLIEKIFLKKFTVENSQLPKYSGTKSIQKTYISSHRYSNRSPNGLASLPWNLRSNWLFFHNHQQAKFHLF